MSYQNTDAQFIRGIRVSIIPPLSGETLIYNLSTKQYEPGAGTGGGLTYEGLWNATTNDPSISDGTGTAGQYYVVEVAGTQDLGSGDIDFTVGDWVIYSNTGVWQRIDASDQVKTVFGRAGEVIAVAGDYTGSQITNVPTDSIESTNSQDAINELVDLNNNRTNGVVTLPTITDNGDGTVDIAADGSFNSYLTPTLGGTIKRWTVATPAVALVPTDGAISYLYADYNAGTPLYGITTDGTGFFTNGDRVAIARVVRDDTEICIIDYDEFGVALPNKSYYKDIALNGFGRQSGLSLSTVATRIPTVEAGSAWLGVTLQTLPENEAGVSGTLYEWHLTAGVWSKSVVTEYDSDYYSDGTDRQTLTSNRHVAKYFYRNVSSNNCVSYISGEQYTTAASALGESIPTAPVTLTASSIYVGKIVIQEGDTNGTAYSRAWDGALDVASTSDHTGLANLNWTSSGHIGTANKIAGFNGTGVATEYSLTDYAALAGATFTGTIIAPVPTTTVQSFILSASAGVDPTTPTSGSLWWNGTNLNFYNGSATTDLLAGGGGLTWGDSITDVNGGTGLSIQEYGGSVTTAFTGIQIGNSSTYTTASGDTTYLNIYSRKNYGTGNATGILVNNNVQDFTAGTEYSGAGISVHQSSAGGTAYALTTIVNVNSTTNGLVNYTLNNTQSGATVMQKIDLGTSAQAHTGLLINAKGASASQVGLKVDMGTTGTGDGIRIENKANNVSTEALFIDMGATGTGRGVYMYRGSSAVGTNSPMVYCMDEQRSNTAKTGDIFDINCKRSIVSGTLSDNFNAYSFIRRNEAYLTGVMTSTGSVIYAENQAAETSISTGSLTDSTTCLKLEQDSNSTGGHILMNSYSGTPTTDGTFYFDGSDLKARIGGTTYTFTKS